MGLANSKSAGQATVGAAGSALLILGLTALTMLAFAANSLFTRLALQTSPIDPASFTAIRIVTGALTLGLIARLGRARITTSWGSMVSAGLLFAYAAAFSFAYRGMDTGAGALVLFASAQLLMIGYGYAKGEKTNILGLVFALCGLVVFLAPSSSAPPFASVGLMVVAGLAWGALFADGSGERVAGLQHCRQFHLGGPPFSGAGAAPSPATDCRSARIFLCHAVRVRDLGFGLRRLVLGPSPHDRDQRRNGAALGSSPKRVARRAGAWRTCLAPKRSFRAHGFARRGFDGDLRPGALALRSIAGDIAQRLATAMENTPPHTTDRNWDCRVTPSEAELILPRLGGHHS